MYPQFAVIRYGTTVASSTGSMCYGDTMAYSCDTAAPMWAPPFPPPPPVVELPDEDEYCAYCWSLWEYEPKKEGMKGKERKRSTCIRCGAPKYRALKASSDMPWGSEDEPYVDYCKYVDFEPGKITEDDVTRELEKLKSLKYKIEQVTQVVNVPWVTKLVDTVLR